MSSSNKTSLGLNLWLGGDKPKREDFCNDNSIIDSVITAHEADSVVHVSESDRANWDDYIFCGAYYGDGQATRDIAITPSFSPRAIILFANGISPSVKDSSDEFVYTAFGTSNGSSLGLQLLDDNKTLRVTQSTVAALQNEWSCLNESGVTYCYICFR